MSKQDGGSAFPIDEYYDEKRIGQRSGMSLRDYFAAKALQGMLANSNEAEWQDLQLREENYGEYCTMFAESAYAMADAMLAERTKAGE